MKEINELFTVGDSAGYEWKEFHVYRHPRDSRKYVVMSDYGCSCDQYWHPTIEQLEAETPLGKREVYAEFTKWWDTSNINDFGYGTKISNLERLRSSL